MSEIDQFGALQVKLPFDHAIVGFIRRNNRTFIAWSRDHPHHPFGTHEIYPSGYCENGSYFTTNIEALNDLSTR